MLGISFAAREMLFAIQRCVYRVKTQYGSLESYFCYSPFPSHKYLLSLISSTKSGIGLTCWLVGFDSKLDWKGQFKQKKLSNVS